MLSDLVYRAPEVKETAKFTFEADAFSFAVIAFEVWIGHKFTDFTPNDQQRILTGFAPRDSSAELKQAYTDVWLQCPSELSSIVTRCWSAEAAERLSFVEDRPDGLAICKTLNTLLQGSSRHSVSEPGCCSRASSAAVCSNTSLIMPSASALLPLDELTHWTCFFRVPRVRRLQG